jgi:hypothetical protein
VIQRNFTISVMWLFSIPPIPCHLDRRRRFLPPQWRDLQVAERDANVCGALRVKTCTLQSAMQMFVERFASRPARCRARCKCLWSALRQDLHVAERDANVCGALCVKTCTLQSAMQMFVERFASRPARCRARCKCLWSALRQDLQVASVSTIVSVGKPAGLSTTHDDKTITLRSR